MGVGALRLSLRLHRPESSGEHLVEALDHGLGRRPSAASPPSSHDVSMQFGEGCVDGRTSVARGRQEERSPQLRREFRRLVFVHLRQVTQVGLVGDDNTGEIGGLLSC